MSNRPLPQKLRLMLLRHAKSGWPEGVADHRRPLAERGRKAARVIGAYMAEHGLVPDLAIVSTARRAEETWEIVSDALPASVTARDAVGIYEVAAPAILKVVRDVEPWVSCLLLVGHNPGMAELALLLAGGGEDLPRLREKFPTAGLAVIDFEAEKWTDVAPGKGRLVRFVTPRLLEAK